MSSGAQSEKGASLAPRAAAWVRGGASPSRAVPDHMEHWKKLSYGGMGLTGAYFAVCALTGHHDHKEDTPAYPHM